jgi:hypothetical protein
MTDTFNPLLHNLQPVNFRQGEHEPQAWDPSGPDNQPASRLTVVLPGEIATAVVLKVVTRNAVVVQLGPCMMTGRGHSYRVKDVIAVRRENDEIGGERWAVVSDRELQQNEMIQRFEAIERALAAPAPAAKALPSPEEKPLRAPVASESSNPADDTSEEVSRVVAPRESAAGGDLPPGEEDRTVEPEREGWGLSEGDFTSRVRDGD